MFTSRELGILNYALILLKAEEQEAPISDTMLDEVNALIKKIRDMKGCH